LLKKINGDSSIRAMDQSEKVKQVLRLQEELIHHRAMLDAGPWLELNMSTPQLKGRLLIEQLVTSWRSLTEALLKGLSPEDLETVRKALGILVNAAQDRDKAEE
jgi:ribosomal protein L29